MTKQTKSVKTTTVAAITPSTRKSSVFTLAPKTDVKTLGDGQRAAIAKALAKTKGATRGKLVAMLPAIKPAIISWYLSKMVAAKLVKKAA
jgi:hypothetical protein